jgi:hypothetical protein
LYSSPSIIRIIKPRRMRWAGHVPWVDNIKMDLKEIGRDGVDWMDMTQARDQWRALVNMVLNLWVPQDDGKFLRAAQLAAPQEGLSSISNLHRSQYKR